MLNKKKYKVVNDKSLDSVKDNFLPPSSKKKKKKEVARVYRRKNSRVKKELKFETSKSKKKRYA